ncbi:LSU ribosomal protein L28P [Tamaricihabitans halophyticus]|uniref:Large ribosomal subunit protein bL28 n=1 Tax=Tamaricihabitans halophyticus TaxID=1262583 RepID=A0A4R2QYM7_9PSEU|nr:50S ribosomal protein L28 [Tamaricihabitans halophyticus]TCP55313.1 LSU ribosomal protein L28P [Tamaricihabitans halophyticus]
MSAVCQVTGKRPGYGNRVSHSQRRTARRWEPNIQRRRYYLASEDRWIRLRVSTTGIKIIDKRGVESVVAELRAKGVHL